jgi:hypothetical protein
VRSAGRLGRSGYGGAIVADEGDDEVQLSQWLECLWSMARAPGNFFVIRAHRGEGSTVGWRNTAA